VVAGPLPPAGGDRGAEAGEPEPDQAGGGRRSGAEAAALVQGQRYEHPDQHPDGHPDAASVSVPGALKASAGPVIEALDTSTEVPTSPSGGTPAAQTRGRSAGGEQPSTGAVPGESSLPHVQDVSRRSGTTSAAMVVAAERAVSALESELAAGTGAATERPGVSRTDRRPPALDHGARPTEAPVERSVVRGTVERPQGSAADVEQSSYIPAHPTQSTAPQRVTVHIGRVVVTPPTSAPPVVAPPVHATAPPAPGTGPLSLEDYLRRRESSST
jgi:hypothetical protein